MRVLEARHHICLGRGSLQQLCLFAMSVYNNYVITTIKNFIYSTVSNRFTNNIWYQKKKFTWNYEKKLYNIRALNQYQADIINLIILIYIWRPAHWLYFVNLCCKVICLLPASPLTPHTHTGWKRLRTLYLERTKFYIGLCFMNNCRTAYTSNNPALQGGSPVLSVDVEQNITGSWTKFTHTHTSTCIFSQKIIFFWSQKLHVHLITMGKKSLFITIFLAWYEWTKCFLDVHF